MATSDEDDGFNAFLAFLQSDTKDIGEVEKEPAQSKAASSNDSAEKEKQQEVHVAEQPNIEKIEDKTQSSSSSLQNDTTDDKADEKGFLDFLSFVYDVPLEPGERKEETPKGNGQTKDQLQNEENEAWVPIESHTKSTVGKPNSDTEDIVATSKKIMKEIIASDEDASRQKIRYMIMELGMLFSLAGADDSGGSKVANIFVCLKNDATKGKVPLA
jgi:hypothetical protein